MPDQPPADTLLSSNVTYNNGQVPTVNISGAASGAHGVIPDLNGINAFTGYMKQNLICICLQTPTGFDAHPDSAILHRSWKNIFETHSTNITGIDNSLNVENNERVLDSAGTPFHDLAKVTKNQSRPVHTLDEKHGKPLKKILNFTARYLYGEEHSQIPLMGTINDQVTDVLSHRISFTNLYFEPDPLHRYVQEAVLVSNMRIDGTVAENILRRDHTASAEPVQYPLEFVGTPSDGDGVLQLAQDILDSMPRIGFNPTALKSHVTGVNAKIANSSGYKSIMEGINSATL